MAAWPLPALVAPTAQGFVTAAQGLATAHGFRAAAAVPGLIRDCTYARAAGNATMATIQGAGKTGPRAPSRAPGGAQLLRFYA